MVQKRSETREYKEVIQDPHFSPPSVLVLTGEEEFFKRDLLAKILETISEGEKGADTFSEETPRSGEEILRLLEDLRTPSFFSTRRLLYCPIQSSLLKRLEEEVEKKLIEALREGLPFGIMVLDLPGLDKSKAFIREAIKKKAVVLCRRLWDTPPPWLSQADPADTELNRWVVFHAKRLGLEISLKEAGELVSLVGNEPGAIDCELKKLLSRYGTNAHVTEEKLRALVEDRRRDSVFTVVEETLQGKTNSALDSLRRLLRFGYKREDQTIYDPASLGSLLLGAFAKKIKTLRRALAVFGQNASPQQLISSGLVPPQGAEITGAQLKHWTLERLERACRLLIKADRKLKGMEGKFHLQSVLETTVVRLAQASLWRNFP